MKPKHQLSTKQFIIGLSVAGLMAGCASDRGATGSDSQSISGSATVTAEDSTFAKEACQASAGEMEISKLAEQNTRNKEIRKFARTLSDDHAEAEKELNKLFSSKGIPPEKELAHDYQSSFDRLIELKGGQFDEAFKQQVITDHENAIALFEKQVAEGTDPDLKAFAQKRLPELRAHMETARGLPISTDTEGPPPETSVKRVLANPPSRYTIPR